MTAENIPANTGRDQDGRDHAGRFIPGVSGNPQGKRKGARHATTIAVEALLEGQAEGLTQKAIEMALAGDTTALRLCLERIAPALRDRPVIFDLPELKTAQDAPAAVLAILHAVARGEITPSEADAISKIVETFRRAVETAELAQRIERLEAAHA